MPVDEHTHAPARGSAVTRGIAGVGFGIAAVAVLLAIDAFAPHVFAQSLPTRAQDGLTLALSVLIESLPFVMLGVILSIAVQVWLPDGVIERFMPRAAWASPVASRWRTMRVSTEPPARRPSPSVSNRSAVLSALAFQPARASSFL